MYNLTREDIDLEAIGARIARMSDDELVKYAQSAAWMAEHNDRVWSENWISRSQNRSSRPRSVE
jgi:hypothetical protein